MTRWTHDGRPVGQPQKPWRLTRAQRVEMEAALARLRGDVRTVPDVDGWYSSETSEVARVLGVHTMEAVNDGVPESVFRARVAIALRAALRADEDARCEEAEGRVLARYSTTYPYAEWRDGAYEHADEMREWPPARLVAFNPVPLALWEIEERRRRETVRVLEALLTWGLS